DPGEGYLDVGHGGVVLGGADVGQGEVFPLKAVKLGIHKYTGDLPGPVRAEVEEDDAVVVGNHTLVVTDNRLHKFVSNAVLVGLGHSGHRIRVLDALAVDHSVISLLHAIPALIPVHSIVAAHDGGNLAYADFLALLH